MGILKDGLQLQHEPCSDPQRPCNGSNTHPVAWRGQSPGFEDAPGNLIGEGHHRLGEKEAVTGSKKMGMGHATYRTMDPRSSLRIET